MADAIKFRCKGCEKKIAVRAEYAGKRVKCPGCKQPIRVPAPRAKRSSTGVPVAVGAAPPESSSSGGSSISLADLLAMEERAPVELRELSSKVTRQSQAPRIEGGKDCPGCDASVKPDAVLCVHCGHNFDSGKKLKTKKIKQKLTPQERVAINAVSNEQTMGLRVLFLIYGALFTLIGLLIAIQSLSMPADRLERMAENGNPIASLPVPVITLIGLLLFFSGISLGWVGCHARLDYSKILTRVICTLGGLPVAMLGAAMVVSPVIKLIMGDRGPLAGILIGLVIMPAGIKMLFSGLSGRAR